MKSVFHTIGEAEHFMDSIPKFSQAGSRAANFNLDRITKFCAEIGNPQNHFPSVHVAGTNGKGTVCQMLASVYQTAGYKTALYTSPHLVNVRERFKINGNDIEESSVLDFFRLFGKLVQQYELTYFELTTAIAFWYFSEEEADIAVIETGLGGRLDATNILKPLASVITSVGLDHTDLLGDTIEKVAAEKAGIIKSGTPVITGRLPEQGKNTITGAAGVSGSEVYSADHYNPVYADGRFILTNGEEEINMNAYGRKKIDALNSAVVFSVIEVLQKKFPVTVNHFMKGIENTDVYYPHHGHFEKLLPEKEWFFDGAHNIEAMNVLSEELAYRAPEQEWKVVLSFMKDKLNSGLTAIWDKYPDVRLYEMEGDRAASYHEMKQFFPKATQIDDDEILKWKDSDQLKSELVIFSGSFYFYEKVRRWMGTIATDYD
ncbi:MAG: Mur ligase family protein [Balneolaceae bacterium]